jgi:hypothetical protein
MRKRPYVLVAAASLTITSGFLASQDGLRYHWHDSSTYSRVIVNATQGIETRPREWFARDRLVTDLQITNVAVIGPSQAREQYWNSRKLLESYGLFVGTYASGTTVLPEVEQTSWPQRTVPIERMPPSAHYVADWPGAPDRKIIDVSDPQTRHAFQKELFRLWNDVPAPVHFVDNAAVHHSAGKGADWSAYCANIREIQRMGAASGSVQIFNIAVHVGLMSDDETAQLISAVAGGGICLEMPWHRNIRQSPQQTENAKNRYRQLLDSGMGVIMMPLDGDVRALVEWVRTWRKPTDHVYISGAFYKAPDLEVFGPGK